MFGGSKNDTLYFENGEWVKFTASAGNWIWPSADEAVITVESGSNNAHFSFEVTFIWKDGHITYWRYPRQIDIGTGEPPDLLKMDSEGKYKVKLKMNCNDSQLLGDAGSKWACDHIYLKGFARIGNEPMQSCEIGPVYF